MKIPKCPECGELLRRRARKCRSCKTNVIVCSECGSAYKKGVSICDMCGKELKRTRIRLPLNEDAQGELEPRDLVSVINRIRSKGIIYKLFRALWWAFALVFAIILLFTALIGFMAGDLFSDLAVMIIGGESLENIGAYFVNTPARNFNIWTAFIGDVTKSDATFAHFFKFSNYLVSVLFLPMLVASAFYVVVYLPMDILEKIFLGVAVRKKGYNASDTVAVFERPTLIYNSNDSFNKAYVYFPFIEKTKGRADAIVSELIRYGANLFCCFFGLFVLVCHTALKIIIRVAPVYMYFSTDAIIAFIAAMAALIYFVVVILVLVSEGLIVKGIQKKQLKYWEIKK